MYLALLLLFGIVAREQVSAFHPPRLHNALASRSFSISAKSNENDYEDLIPETSFGSEVVPEEQRPVNEYLDIIRQPLFDWADEERGSKGLFTRLSMLYSVVFIAICYPIAGATYTQEGFLLQKLAASNVGALLLILLLLIRLYSGWSYVGSRLTSKVIEYEETGWFDGNFELKTDRERMRDRMVFQEKVKPVVERLKTFSLATGGLWVASVVSLNIANSYKPVFQQYDPAVLERIRYDESLAESAAKNTGGRPTYCDNRYYRAVANGGQGCK